MAMDADSGFNGHADDPMTFDVRSLLTSMSGLWYSVWAETSPKQQSARFESCQGHQ
jgi:hypothetical protein